MPAIECVVNVGKKSKNKRTHHLIFTHLLRKSHDTWVIKRIKASHCSVSHLELCNQLWMYRSLSLNLNDGHIGIIPPLRAMTRQISQSYMKLMNFPDQSSTRCRRLTPDQPTPFRGCAQFSLPELEEDVRAKNHVRIFYFLPLDLVFFFKKNCLSQL